MTPGKLSIVLALALTSCVVGTDYRPAADDCVTAEGNQWCTEKHGQALHCRHDWPSCGRTSKDGCEAEPPADPACYSPCGRGLSLSEVDVSCEGYDGSTTSGVASTGSTTNSTTSTSTTSEETSSEGETGSESSSTGDVVVACTAHTDCADAEAPACGDDGTCVACDAIADGDTACATHDEGAPLCREGACVPCHGSNTDACPAEMPTCQDFTCVECTSDDDSACSVARPVCSENTCVPCTADDIGACANDAARPVCFENTCVACTEDDPGACTGETPVCDTETNTCVPCAEHGQCESGVCNVDTGACFSAANVLVVDGGPGCTNNTEPFCRIGQAVSAIPQGQLTAVLVHALGGDTPYFESIILDGALTALFVAAGEDPPRIQGNGGPGLTVSGGAIAHLERIQFRGNTSGLGLLVTGEGSRAVLDRCVVALNRTGGISITTNGALELVNSFVSGDSDADALAVTGGTAAILYSTLAGQYGVSHALACDETSSVTVRNSFFVARHDDDEVQCDAASFSYSAAEMSLPGTGTFQLGPLELSWFSNIGQGDLHLNEPPNGLLRAAQWQPGDPSIDIEGDARPTTEGEMGVAGADVP